MKKFAVFGNPIKQSLSPIIHQMFAESCGLDISYTREYAEINEFKKVLGAFFHDPSVMGCNVTMPFKHEAFDLVDRCDESAKLAQAVNTIKKEENGTLTGFNTDGIGLVTDLLNNGAILKNETVLLIGAGGAAKGVVNPLLDSGVKQLLILNRSYDRAQALVNLCASDKLLAVSSAKECDSFSPSVIINSTSASLSDQLPAVCPAHFNRCSIAYDMVYKSQPTAFMMHAKSLGASKQLDGLGMLVEQAAAAFTIWTSKKPNTSIVLEHLESLR